MYSQVPKGRFSVARRHAAPVKPSCLELSCSLLLEAALILGWLIGVCFYMVGMISELQQKHSLKS